MTTIRIDPRDFIMGPFLVCPNCGKQEYGVLDVSDTRCNRRCRACLFRGTVYLPEIKKKIVYVDQFAFSNIMKFLSPGVKGHGRASSEPFWKALFEALESVCRLQLVACPDSREHEHESLTSPFYKALKLTYEHFSGGVSFDDAETIRIRQISHLAKAWLKNDKAKFDFDAESIATGRLHEWSGRIFVTVDAVLPGTVDQLRTARDRTHDALQDVFQGWQSEKKPFKEVLEVEKAAYAKTVIELYVKDCQKRAQMTVMIMRGHMPPLEDVLPSRTENLVANLRYLFQEKLGKAPGDARLAEFFKSGAINDVPFNLIGATMYASLAAKAAAGQKKMPSQGTVTDIIIVSALLPYCDAMFMDNECKALLQDVPKDFALPYACKVFSPNAGADFIRYLNEIKNSATPQHVKLIEQVYGPEALQPASGIYGLGKRERASEN